MKTVIRIYTPVGYSAYPSITFVKMRVYAVTLVAYLVSAAVTSTAVRR